MPKEKKSEFVVGDRVEKLESATRFESTPPKPRYFVSEHIQGLMIGGELVPGGKEIIGVDEIPAFYLANGQVRVQY